MWCAGISVEKRVFDVFGLNLAFCIPFVAALNVKGFRYDLQGLATVAY